MDFTAKNLFRIHLPLGGSKRNQKSNELSKKIKGKFENGIMRTYTKDNLILVTNLINWQKKPFNIESDIKRLKYAKKFIAQNQII